MLPEKYRYIVVEGPIGAGKTSLARRLSEHAGKSLLLEDPDSNPFLARFYEDQRRYALATQLFFLFQRAQQVAGLKQIDLFDRGTVADFILDKDPLFASLTLSDDELHLYYSDSPLGPWKPHKKNPVKSDVRSSRPAGKPFYWNGELLRPAQDSSRGYGYATSINRVVKISPCEYSEVEVSRILPDWAKHITGTHTLNILDDITVVDCLLKTTKPLSG